MALLSSVDFNTPKKCKATTVMSSAGLTETVTEIDMTDDIPIDAKGVRLLLYWNRSSGSVIIQVGPESDKSVIDDRVYDYQQTSFISDHVSTRVTDRKCYIWTNSSGSGNVTCDANITEIYY